MVNINGIFHKQAKILNEIISKWKFVYDKCDLG